MNVFKLLLDTVYEKGIVRIITEYVDCDIIEDVNTERETQFTYCARWQDVDLNNETNFTECYLCKIAHCDKCSLIVHTHTYSDYGVCDICSWLYFTELFG